MTPYKLTTVKKQINNFTLFQIELTQNCKWGKAGDKGGWIEKMENLSEDARVYGDAWAKSPIQIQGTRHFINVCKHGWIKIGCLEYTFDKWQKSYDTIGKSNGYSKQEIQEYKNFINAIIKTSK